MESSIQEYEDRNENYEAYQIAEILDILDDSVIVRLGRVSKPGKNSHKRYRAQKGIESKPDRLHLGDSGRK